MHRSVCNIIPLRHDPIVTEEANVRSRLACVVSEKTERFFSHLAQALSESGSKKFIVVGGETSGVFTQGLNIRGLIIGNTVAPGAPWTQVLDEKERFILKSGNSDFFLKAQEHFHE
ncbi:hypothetical protein O3W44_21215 [Pantoea sp. LMR881]|uniref:nucleotide-binding domain containing protein n=1 Tax=Pantoea sp. LMR881 TaxID=3014336 RepID=UPI0022AEFE67|nr:nucleotide-binding domain containing protein [Pantoea sp. LMR881]MCZ4061068.1 hypothetical protein [Pantoea sp. LMR881]